MRYERVIWLIVTALFLISGIMIVTTKKVKAADACYAGATIYYVTNNGEVINACDKSRYKPKCYDWRKP